MTWVGLEPPFGTFVGAAMTTWFAALAVLMVSSVPYASLKLVRVEGRRAYPTLVGIILFTIALLLNHEWMFFSLGVVFVASGPAYAWYRWRTKAEEPVSAEGSGERFDG